MSSYQIMLFSVFHPGSYSKLFLLKLGKCKATLLLFCNSTAVMPGFGSFQF